MSRAAETRPVPISAETFNKILPGKTIKGEYRFLRARTDTFNFSETHNADGTTLYKEGPLSEPGIWYTLKAPAGSTAGGKVCYKYIGPQMSGTHCFWVYEEDGCYYGYGRNNITLDGPRSFNDWTARWIIKGSGKTCATPLS